MVASNRIAEIAAAIGDPARAAMLTTLFDGRALTAAELALAAGVTPQTASTHLARLASVALLKIEKQGRHRYHRLASTDVARMLEQMMQHASLKLPQARNVRTGPRDARMREARTCYDHLAGRVAVRISDSFIKAGYIELGDEAGLITPRGLKHFSRAGLLADEADARGTRPLCRPCLDWSERRPHLGGRFGAALCQCGFDKGWFRRFDKTRAVEITPKGFRALREQFGVRVD